jgi:hypothetical protein
MSCKQYDTLTLMSFVSEDLDEGTMSEIHNHLTGCKECNAVVNRLRKEKEDFLQQYPVSPSHPESTVSRIIPFPVRSILAIAASLIISVTAGYFVLTQDRQDGYRIKGATQLDMYVLDETGVPSKRGNSMYYPGEKIQFTYSTGINKNFILLSIDTSKVITQFYPTQKDSSVKLAPGRDLPLPHSITLDGYIGPELYLAIFSESPLYIIDVKEKLRGSLSHSRTFEDLRLNLDNAEIHRVYISKLERKP